MNKVFTIVLVILIVGIAGWYFMKGSSNQIPSTGSSTTQQQQQPSTSVSEKPEVTLTSSGFEPSSLTVKAGSKVTWTNKSRDAATVNSNNHPTHLLYPPLNLGEFKNGDSLSLTFDKPGTYGYHNHLNPSETGEIVVQ